MVVGLRHFTQGASAGAGAVNPVLDTQNGEELMHVQNNVSIVLGIGHSESPGTLYTTNKKVIWLDDMDREKGYAVDFLSISLHAVSRDPEAYPSPCLYAQIETEVDEDESEGSDSESDQPFDISKVREMRVIPSDPSQLDTLFQIFCEGAELNPEPIEEEDEVEHNWVFSADQIRDDAAGEDSEIYFSENANIIGHSNGNHELAQAVLQLEMNDQRFEDAEEMEHESKTQHDQ